MPDINSLGLSGETIPSVNLSDLPEQKGGFDPLPQPGVHIFTLPTKVDDIFETVLTEKGNRLKAVFKGKSSLKVDGALSIMYNLTNREFFDVEAKKFGNEFAYLLHAAGFDGVLTTNEAYAEALKKVAGQSFGGVIEWNTTSRATGTKYSSNPWGDRKPIPQVKGMYCERFQEEGTENIIRAFPNIKKYYRLPASV